MSGRIFDIAGSVPDGSDALAACFDARDYHTGQWSQLYALSSSGKVTDLFYLRQELRHAIETAESFDSDDEEEVVEAISAAENFRALVAWIDAQPESDVYGEEED